MGPGYCSPEISDALITAPVVASYSPTVFRPPVETNKLFPDTARKSATPNPVINDALTVTPPVVYSPIVPVLKFATYKLPPDTAMPVGLLNPRISGALTVAPLVVYAPIVD